MLEAVFIYIGVKLMLAGLSWFWLSKTRRNIAEHIEMLKRKPTTGRRPRSFQLTSREKLVRAIPGCILIPGIGEILLIAITIGRFSNKAKIEQIYLRALEKLDNNNISDALEMMGETNRRSYLTLKRNADYLSVAGHSEIAKQSVLTLNNLIIDANIRGIDLKKDPSIKEAIDETAGLISELLKEEQLGIQSNIDTYLNVIESIKSDLSGKQSVFMESAMTSSNDNDKE